jgi:hypothetical protein
VSSIAARLSAPGNVPVVTDFYGWGPWVNGGTWIHTPVGKVDLIYRNLDQVERVIEEGSRGVCGHDYDQQPPYGFRSVIYFGETDICVPLYDPDGELARLKQRVAKYPEPMRASIVQDSLWSAEFSLIFCRRFAAVADVYNASGCMSRVAHYLVQGLFALNRQYFLSDKYTKRVLERFSLLPRDFMIRLEAVLACPGADPDRLGRSTELLSALWLEAVGLAEGAYQPRYRL